MTTHRPLPAGPAFEPSRGPSPFARPDGGVDEVGLALSGGGLRAVLFHLGALMRLRELGWLSRLDRVSGVSGGAIMAAILGRAWHHLERGGFSERAFERSVTRPTLSFARRHIDLVVLTAGLVPLVNPAGLLERWFDHDLTHGMRLSQLPDRPRFYFDAVHLATGDLWHFSKATMGDDRLGLVQHPDLPIASALAASAAYPPFVAPYVLDLRRHDLRPTAGSDLYHGPQAKPLHERVLLLDGGVHDNLGVEPIAGHSRIALASDAGSNLRVDARHTPFRFWWALVERTLDISVEISRTHMRRHLIERVVDARERPAGDARKTAIGTEHVALWRTSLGISGDPLLPSGWAIHGGWADYLSTRPTRLWPMAEADRDRLIDWGYLTADLTLRRYVPELSTAAGPVALPNGSDFARPPA